MHRVTFDEGAGHAEAVDDFIARVRCAGRSPGRWGLTRLSEHPHSQRAHAVAKAEIELIADAVEKRVCARLEPRFVETEQQLDRVERRLDRVERKVDDLAGVLQGMATGHSPWFDAIESKIGPVRRVV